jgi:hypothetical protein
MGHLSQKFARNRLALTRVSWGGLLALAALFAAIGSAAADGGPALSVRLVGNDRAISDDGSVVDWNLDVTASTDSPDLLGNVNFKMVNADSSIVVESADLYPDLWTLYLFDDSRALLDVWVNCVVKLPNGSFPAVAEVVVTPPIVGVDVFMATSLGWVELPTFVGMNDKNDLTVSIIDALKRSRPTFKFDDPEEPAPLPPLVPQTPR